jgi:HAD superfamily hydrolase (TIGR01509 family)
LRAVGLHGRFAVSVAGDEVAAGKPAPDGYLAAMYALGVDPASGVAIEDSVMGVRSALAAGMRVVAVVREPDQRRDLIATGVLVVDRVHYSQLDL